MAPNTTAIFSEPTPTESLPLEQKLNPKPAIVWRNVILFAYLHGAALYGFLLVFTSAKLATTLLAYILYVCGGVGITAGAHRLWSHKAYKARLPLRIILMIFNTLAFQNSIYEWARDHRVHHKHSETDADPHNAKRGMFFSHVGWLLVRKHPLVIEKGKGIELNDLLQDKVVDFQRRYYLPMMVVLCFIIPTCIPVYLWGESWHNSWFVATMFRYTVTLNATWLVNSIAHFYGGKPFDKNMNPAENIVVALGAFGEGWHNYHHTFPWDYKTAELGNYRANFTTMFIDFFAKIGWAYDMKTVSPEMIVKRAKRTGDGSYVPPAHYPKIETDAKIHEHSHEGEVWGWDDKDLDPEVKSEATVVNSCKEE